MVGADSHSELKPLFVKKFYKQ